MKRTLESLDPAAIEGRRALVRVDFNCPVKDGAVSDNTRIRAALPTIKYLRDKGARLVLLSHLGRPKGGPDPKYSMQPVVRELERLLGAPVTFLEDPTSEAAVTATRRLPRGGVAVGENTRFYPGEEKNDRALAERFAALGDFYVNDAFGSAHRAHASTEAVARLLKPAVSGFLMQQELRYLGEALHQPKRPFVAVLGGAKISGKIDLIEALLPKTDAILLGGAMACTFFRAMGLETGNSLVEEDRVDLARTLMQKAGDKLRLPTGAVIAQKLEAGTETRAVARDAIPAGWAVYDIDPATERDFAGRIGARRHGGVERTDGRVRDAAVRPRHAGHRPGDGGGDGTRGRDRDRRRRLRGSGGAGRPRGSDHPRLHRRRRVAGVPGRQRAAGRRRAGRGLIGWPGAR